MVQSLDHKLYVLYMPSNLEHYYKQEFCIIENSFQEKIIVLSLSSRLLEMEIKSKYLAKENAVEIYRLDQNTFREFLKDISKNYNLLNAKYNLRIQFPTLSSHKIGALYKTLALTMFILLAAFSFVSSKAFLMLNNIAYIISHFIKICLFYMPIFNPVNKADESQKVSLPQVSTQNLPQGLPLYSIMIPLYKEEESIKFILKMLDKINYPRNKLDVKIILEEDDFKTINKLKSYVVEDFIDIIVVPVSSPRTKPKALNYALPFIRGKYVVVYDAEDMPEPDQILKALNLFESLDKRYACLQASLNFYNRNDNFLTRLFSIEYSMWFDHFMYSLSNSMMPIPLGGSSNHFKVNVLRKIGGWDAYNVTEDAEIGIRLHLLGYKTKMFDSFTLEEGVSGIKSWLKQRARWIKGFIKTYIVYLTKGQDFKENFKLNFTVHFFVGASIYSFISVPLMFISYSYTNDHKLAIFNLFIMLCYNYSASLFIISFGKVYLKDTMKNRIKNFIAVIIFPLYFTLHIISSYMAFYSFIRNTFKWNKTKHNPYLTRTYN